MFTWYLTQTKAEKSVTCVLVVDIIIRCVRERCFIQYEVTVLVTAGGDGRFAGKNKVAF